MARYHRDGAGLEPVPSVPHVPGSSPRTSESGRATPSSGSSPNTFDWYRPLPPTTTGTSSRAADGGEAYELRDFGGRDGGEYGHDDDEDEDDDTDARMMGAKHRKGDARRRGESDDSNPLVFTPDEEKVVVRKFDRRLVLFLAFCYMLSFVDRSSAFSYYSLIRAFLFVPVLARKGSTRA